MGIGGLWYAEAMSKNSSGKSLRQLTYSDAVRTRSPHMLINKTRFIKRLLPFITNKI